MTKKKTNFDKEINILTDRYVTLDELMSVPAGVSVELDLGCGSGDFSLGLAKKYPERLVFAADIQLNRIRKTASRCERAGLTNVRYFRVEARYFLTVVLPDSALDRIHIICPDPWPKNRHRSHRLIASDFTAQICRVLKPDGVLHFATDDPDYRVNAEKILQESGLLVRADDDRVADVSEIKTEFERQWLASGKTVFHTAWIRNNNIQR